MQTTILKKDFIKALTIGGAMAGKNKTLPILENAKVDIVDNTLAVHSFNGESWVTKRVSIENTDANYSFCVNANDLTKVLKSLVEELVTFAIDGNLLRISHIKGVLEMPIVNGELFPKSQTWTDGISISISSDKMREWITFATNFVSNDELRAVMTGMYLYAKGGRIGVCATDVYRLFTDSIVAESDDFGVIIPASGFKPLLNIIANVQDVNVVISSKNITFSTSDAELNCRLVEGNYPNFNAVIPQNNGIVVKVSKSELLDSVNRASIMANKSTSLLKLSFTDTTMSIVGSDNEFSTKACENVGVQKSGADVAIGVKSEFFATCLGIVSAEEVILKLGDSDRAIVIEDSLCKDMVMLVMPMSI